MISQSLFLFVSDTAIYSILQEKKYDKILAQNLRLFYADQDKPYNTGIFPKKWKLSKEAGKRGQDCEKFFQTSLLLLIILIVSSPGMAKVLDVPQVYQEEIECCWAGVSQSTVTGVESDMIRIVDPLYGPSANTHSWLRAHTRNAYQASYTQYYF